VQHYAAPGDATFAGSRGHGKVPAAAGAGAFERYDDATNESLARQSTFEWPHAFARLQ